MGASGPHLIHGSRAHPSPQPKRQLDRCSRFAALTSVTDRQTDRPRYSVNKNGRIYVRSTAMRPNNWYQEFPAKRRCLLFRQNNLKVLRLFPIIHG